MISVIIFTVGLIIFCVSVYQVVQRSHKHKQYDQQCVHIDKTMYEISQHSIYLRTVGCHEMANQLNQTLLYLLELEIERISKLPIG